MCCKALGFVDRSSFHSSLTQDLVDFTPGDGSAALSYIRNKRGYIGICFNDFHVEALRKFLVASVMKAFSTADDPLFMPGYAAGLDSTKTKNDDPKREKKVKKDKEKEKKEKEKKGAAGKTKKAQASKTKKRRQQDPIPEFMMPRFPWRLHVRVACFVNEWFGAQAFASLTKVGL